MKKHVLSLAVFLSVFAAAYLFCCFCIPGWRIKLETDAATYFAESLKSMALIKGTVALAVGAAAAALTRFFSR